MFTFLILIRDIIQVNFVLLTCVGTVFWGFIITNCSFLCRCSS